MLGIGVIGLGAMGLIHLETLQTLTPRVRVSSVFDVVDNATARVAADAGARVANSAEDVVRDPSVDAVLIASPAPQHADVVRSCLEVGKPVFCEKPVVTSRTQWSELAGFLDTPGEVLVWTGFMRRFDPAFVALRTRYQEDQVGQAIFLDMAHRNPAVPITFGNDAYMNETFIHEFDVLRWLLGEEIVAVQVDRLGPVRTGGVLNDPQHLTLWSESGVTCRISGHITNDYGYEIRCEIVGQRGSVSLSSSPSDGEQPPLGDSSFSSNWADRFEDAYRSIVRSWVADLEKGMHTGVGLRDALAASAVALAGVEAQREPGRPVTV